MTAVADEVLREGRAAVRREAGGVLGVADQLDETFVEAARWLYECRGKVFVTGAGTSGAIARRMAHLLAVCGTPAVFIQAADALHGTMGAVTEGDILIAISRGGGSGEINDLTTRVRERGAMVIALTADAGSELGRRADLVVELDSPPEVDPGEVIAMGSTLAVAVWGDALAYVLMRLRGYGWDRVLHSHPSGAVGRIEHVPDPLPALTFDATEKT
ncbi:SIS domain-containing protein [Spongiactinospora sp. 9N601]|uniref:SIS domain-containing protein n=1 Tax=Spongiactinospora sp. 9N601 TaxID=3375149 RepID=UPI0037A85A6F